MLRLVLYLLLLTGVCCARADAGGGAVPVGPGIATLALNGYLHATLPGESPATAQEALARYREGWFVRLPGYLGRGYREGVVWLAFDLEADAGAPEILILDVGPAYLDEVRAYQVSAAGVITPLGRAGDQVPPAEVFVRGLRPAFAIHSSEARTVLLEIRTTSTKAAIVKLHAGAAYPALQAAESLAFGAVLALNLIMALGALALYRLFRDRVYLLWMFFVLLTGAHAMLLDGVVSLFIERGDRIHINVATNVSSVLLFATGTLLATHLFQFRLLHRWLHAVFVVWAAAMLVPLIASPFMDARLVGALAMLVWPLYLLVIVAICVQIKRGHRVSRLFGPIFVIHIAAALLNVLAILGLRPFSEVTLYAWQITSLLNLLSVQVAMFVRMREHLAESARHRDRLMQALNTKNDELEHQVSERTASLAQALHDVQQAESEQRQLLSMASHEFRTPAAMIKTSLDSLRLLATRVPAEVAQRLRNIEHACTRMIDLSNNLIHQDRLHELALHPSLEAVELRALMAEVVSRYARDPGDVCCPRVILEAPTAPMSAPMSERDTTLQADSALVGIALHNLIDNALQHGVRAEGATPGAADIRVSLELLPEHLELRVADRGPGIPDGDKQTVFKRFYCLAKRKILAAAPPCEVPSYGDGLGLSIVYAIARAHGGVAYAADNSQGGAVLTLRLPRVAEAPARADQGQR